MHRLSITVWGTIAGWILHMLLIDPTFVNSEPVSVDFNLCQTSEYPTLPIPNSPNAPIQCCPPKPTQDAVDGLPPPTSKRLRVREAYQCTSRAYRRKLEKAYDLMRALPDDDPRSFTQQWYLHCSYCGGAFYIDNGGNTSRGIDIHFSWLFFPWHRFFLYFHERILQCLLGDPSFSLNYWNWDNPFSTGRSSRKSCHRVGHDFPSAYQDTSASLYDVNRSQNAKGFGRLDFPDLSFSPQLPAAQQQLFNAPEAIVIKNNLNQMYQVMVSNAPTAELFMGIPYRAGDLRGNPGPTGGGGLFELSVHGGPHFWTGQDPPVVVNDMGALAYSARDPVFYSHHSNVDRLWKAWRDIGPTIGQPRAYFDDPDFLDASFLFYDENKVLRRVKVRDGLDTTKLGYTYQKANDDLWLFYNQTRCSNTSYADLIDQAENLSPPAKNSNGTYTLEAGQTFSILVPYTGDGGGAIVLTIDGIELDRQINDGFDVYLDLIDPTSMEYSFICAEYIGRFLNIAQGQGTIMGTDMLMWKASIASKWPTLGIPSTATQVLVTIVPLNQAAGTDTITFKSVSIGSS